VPSQTKETGFTVTASSGRMGLRSHLTTQSGNATDMKDNGPDHVHSKLLIRDRSKSVSLHPFGSRNWAVKKSFEIHRRDKQGHRSIGRPKRNKKVLQFSEAGGEIGDDWRASTKDQTLSSLEEALCTPAMSWKERDAPTLVGGRENFYRNQWRRPIEKNCVGLLQLQ